MDTGSVLVSDTTKNYDVFLCPTLCQERCDVKDIFILRDNQKLSVFIQVGQDHWKFPKINTCCVIINAYVY